MIRFFKFFLSKLFWINFILALIVLYAGFYFTMNNLDSYTNHGVKIEVPTLLGTHINDVEDSLSELNLRFEIRDSVFSDNYPMGIIIQQDPKPHTENFPNYVKPNRRIYLTIVKKQESFKILPDLLSKVTSKTIGKSRLEMLGFNVELELRDHKDRDKVLEVLYQDNPVKAGFKLPRGSELILVYGSGDKGKPIELPDFKGMNIQLAQNMANNIGLELEVHYFDSLMNGDDSLNAVIFNQYPDPKINNKSLISIGSTITVDADLSSPIDSTYFLDSSNVILPIE
ncbi:MAG: PASTA domain-containing protein [Parvicellaceae bacterium]